MRGAAGLTGPQGPQGAQGLPGSRGITGATGAAGVNGLPGPRGLPGATGPTGVPGTPGLRGATGPAGAPGPRGVTGSIGTPGLRGATGATGPQGIQGLPGQLSSVYAGLFNSGACELEVRPDEVIALTFSGRMPHQSSRYDENHSIVVNERGIYEIHFAMHGEGLSCAHLDTAVTNDGMILPGSALSTRLEEGTPFTASGTLLAEVKAGAHLHFIAYANGGARFALSKGMNLALEAKKIAE